VVGFADQLHVTVLDAIVDHLDEVACTAVAHPLAAGLAVGLGTDRLEDGTDEGPRGLVATGHQRGSVAGTLLATTHAGSHVEQTQFGQLVAAAGCVLVLGVAAIDDHITGGEQRHQLLDEIVDRTASWN